MCQKVDPADQNLNIGDSCVPELASSGLGLIPPINHQNDQCYLVYTNGATWWFFATLPNGVKIKISGSIENSQEFFFQWIYNHIEITIEDEITDPKVIIETKNFIKGLQEALNTITSQGISLEDLGRLLNNLSLMGKNYFDQFKKLTGPRTKNTLSAEYEFMYHATIGCYIAINMHNFYPGDREEEKVNREIGFWVSCYAEKAKVYNPKLNIPLKTTFGFLGYQLGLVDIANLVKCLAHAEHGDGIKVESNVIYGYGGGGEFDFLNVKTAWSYLQAGTFGSKIFNDMNFKDSQYKGYSNRFINIAIGIGVLFTAMTWTYNEDVYNRPLSLYDWLRAARRFNGNTKEKGSETYIHSLKIPKLLGTLFDDDIWFYQNEISRFIKYVENKAPDD